MDLLKAARKYYSTAGATKADILLNEGKDLSITALVQRMNDTLARSKGIDD